ncbi:MAG: transposase [Candidatus Rokubacteria bacterium]|nr:transposase [Candidatus Rokubacteria bacterium]
MSQERSEARCYDMLRQARWPNGMTCPGCGGRRITTHSRSPRTPRRRYLCLSCRRTFSDLTATPLAQTNLPLAKWFECLRLLPGRHTTAGLAKALDVKWDTAVRLQRQLATSPGRPGLVQRLRQILGEADHG